MAKTPTLTSNLLGIGSNQQQGLIGSDLSNIGILPLQDQLAKEIEQKQREKLSKNIDSQVVPPLGPITFADDFAKFYQSGCN